MVNSNLMSKRKFLAIIKRRILPKLKGRISVKKVSRDLVSGDWTKQLRGIETLGQGLVVMRMG